MSLSELFGELGTMSVIERPPSIVSTFRGAPREAVDCQMMKTLIPGIPSGPLLLRMRLTVGVEEGNDPNQAGLPRNMSSY